MRESNIKNKIKLIALDLDGTTLNAKGQFSNRTKEAFAAAMAKDIHIVISTGRAFSSLPKDLFNIKGLEYVITSNGAQITEIATMKAIYTNYISSHAIEEVVEILRKNKLSVEAFTGGKAYIDAREYEEVSTKGSTYRDVDYIIRTRNPVEGIYDHMLSHKDAIENINVNFEFLEDKEKMGHVLRSIDNITLTSSFIHNWEIGGATTSKGEALRFLMQKLDIHKSQMLACGDSPNDSEMLKLAGIGVAMANATDEVKNIADIIADHHDNDGVAKIIEKYI
ncbi:MAG: HAD family hydrolase [Eubacteriales bacterium]|nr:HAD family hydrolase [Eubacteriales bacterium]